MSFKKVLVVSDNPFLTEKVLSLFESVCGSDVTLTLACSPSTGNMMTPGKFPLPVVPIQVKFEWESLSSFYDLIISIHCKQLFPAELVNSVRCINVHPGFNPYNRGWYPQVFAIMNGLPHGATIHEMDEQLDHGGIIAQRQVPIHVSDTSKTVYDRVLEAEITLLEENLEKILNNQYDTFYPEMEGNLNLIKDFRELLHLDVEEVGTMMEVINKLRALSHGEYKNAYFIDPESGKKVFISINLEMEG